MRKYLIGGIVAAVLVVFGMGLAPPALARGKVDHAAVVASKAGSAALVSGGTAAADDAALRTLATQPNLHIVSMGPVPGTNATFAVTVQERIHTFLDRFSGLKSWFVVTSTHQSTSGN